MISNDRQYRVTKAAVRRFEQALASTDEQNTETDPRLVQAMKEGMESDIRALREQLAEYEAFSSGKVAEFTVDFEHLADALIRARIAAGLTQKELAERLGVKEQQIQRYEAKEYEPASFARLKEVVWALNLRVQLCVTLPGPTQEFDVREPGPEAYAGTMK